MTSAKTESGISPVPLVGPDARFEAWYASRGLSPWAHWHPERKGYTLASQKQLCWEAWQAAMTAHLDVVDAACEAMEMAAMHEESAYKALKALYSDRLMRPNNRI